MLQTIRETSKLAVLRTKALVSFGRLVRDPNRLDEVFAIADALSQADQGPMREMVAALSKREDGARAFRERPRIGTIDLATLLALPDGTLGHAFAEHMNANGLVPEALPSLEAHNDLDYLRAHLYETHDVWHVVAGFGTDVAGELGLQAFYLAQTSGPLPRTLLTLGLLNSALYAREDFDRRVSEIARGFAIGSQARPFFGVRWADRWSTPLEDVRRELGVESSSVTLAAA